MYSFLSQVLLLKTIFHQKYLILDFLDYCMTNPEIKVFLIVEKILNQCYYNTAILLVFRNLWKKLGNACQN